jgi:hypothetical protein
MPKIIVDGCCIKCTFVSYLRRYKVIKKRKKIGYFILLLLLVVGAALVTAFYSSSFQTILAKKYLNYLQKQLHTTITLDNVDIEFFDDVVIHKLYIEDQHQDTLLYVQELRVDIGLFSLTNNQILLEKATFNNTYFNLQKHKEDTTNNLSFIIDYFTPADTSQSKSEWVFKLKDVEFVNSRFNYDDANFLQENYGVDFNHIGITQFNTKLNDIEFIPDGVSCDIDKMQLVDQSGFVIDTLNTVFNISPKGIITEKFHLVTPKSNIKGDILFLTNTYADLSNFIEDVTIKSNFNKSLVNFKDISYFAPNLEGLNKSLSLQGEVKGSIDNLKGRDLSIVFDDGTKFKGKADISGLPNPEDMFIHVSFKELLTSKSKLEKLPTYPFTKGEYLELPANLNHLGTIRFKGSFTGFYHDFVAYGKFDTQLGSLTTDLAVKVKNNKTSYKGKLITNHFKLGHFLETKEMVGDISMNLKIDGEGFTTEDLDANLEGNISQIVFKNYEYNNITLNGDFKNQIFIGFIGVEDENVYFDFDGVADFSHSIPRYNFLSTIENAKLAKLNFVESKQQLKTRFSTQLQVNLEGSDLSNIVGEIAILNSKYHDKLDSIIVDSLIITSSKIEETRSINIKSDVLDFNMAGVFDFLDLQNASTHFLEKYLPSFKNEMLTEKISNYNFTFDLVLHNSEIISKVLLDGANFSPETSFSGGYNSAQYLLTVNGVIPEANFSGVNLKNGKVTVKSNISSVISEFTADKISQNDSVYTDNFMFNTDVLNDSLIGGISWDNSSTSVRSKAEIKFNTFFNGYDYSITKINNSQIYIADSLWVFNDDNFIELDGEILTVKNLSFSSKNQRALIDGIYSLSESDKVDVSLKAFNLSLLNKIIPQTNFQLNGIADGVASLGKKDSSMIFTSDLTLNNIEINDYLIGDGSIKSNWNSQNNSIELNGELYRENIPSIKLEGVYFLERDTNSLAMDFELNKTELRLFESFFDEYVKDLKGVANAKVNIRGTLDKPELNGYVELPLETSFFVNYLNTSFSTKDIRIDITPDMIAFDNVKIYDKFGNNGFANGTVYHEWYEDISLDLGLSVDHFLALNTTIKNNNTYYGKAYVTGSLGIGSYDNFMNLYVNVKTEAGTILNIPLDEAEEIEENNFIEFVTRDTLKIEVEEEVDLSHLNMNFNFDVTPDAEVRLIFDEQIGDVMKATGTGNIKLNVSSTGDLEMFGDYIINDGDYLFTLQNVINKKFDLEQGGTIAWNGSPYEAVINITAVYRLRARLYDLLAGFGDTTAIYKKRIPVDLKLKMQNSMLNPDIGFDIVLPTADEATKTKVSSVLNVNDNNEEGIQSLNKQVFSLLVLNQFLPPPGTESTTSTANVGAVTSSEMLSNQLSNWLSKMSNDFDVGVNYRPGDEISSQELEVALSTQIFNDRVIIDSNFGMTDNSGTSTTQNSSNIVGDITVQYKITEDGKIRVKAFNVSNQYSLENPNSDYTQGVGLSYREDFDTWGEFFGKLFGRFNKEK